MDILDQSKWFLNSSSSSSNSSSSSSSVPFQGGSSVAAAAMSLAVFLVGLLGNSLAIYVVLCCTKTKSVTNVYILNLALADELYILGLPFLAAQNALSYWPFGSALCRAVMTADSMNQFTSVFCLTVMSVDRYLAVVHPVRSTRWRHPRIAKAVSAAMWGVSFVMVLPVVIFSDVQDVFNSCNMIWPEPNKVWSTAFVLYTSTLGFFGPLLIICLCYLLIVIKVKSSGAKAGFTRRRRSERRVTRMVVVFVLVFVLCWLPFFIINLVNLVVVIPESPASAGLYFFAVILSYANSCANPLLYGFLSDNFKQSLRKVLCMKTLRCSSNGVDDGDLNAARSEKTTAHDCILMSSSRKQPENGAPSCQVCPHLPDSPTCLTTADLHQSSAPGVEPVTSAVTFSPAPSGPLAPPPPSEPGGRHDLSPLPVSNMAEECEQR